LTPFGDFQKDRHLKTLDAQCPSAWDSELVENRRNAARGLRHLADVRYVPIRQFDGIAKANPLSTSALFRRNAQFAPRCAPDALNAQQRMQVEQAYRGGAGSVSRFVRRCWPGASPSDIEEVLAETWLRLVQSYANEDEETKRRGVQAAIGVGWMCVVARSIWIERGRMQSRQRRLYARVTANARIAAVQSREARASQAQAVREYGLASTVTLLLSSVGSRD